MPKLPLIRLRIFLPDRECPTFNTASFAEQYSDRIANRDIILLKCKAKERETTQLVLLNKNMEDAIIKDHREMKENILSYVDVILSKFWVIVRFEFTTLV